MGVCVVSEVGRGWNVVGGMGSRASIGWIPSGFYYVSVFLSLVFLTTTTRDEGSVFCFCFCFVLFGLGWALLGCLGFHPSIMIPAGRSFCGGEGFPSLSLSYV